MKHLMLLLICGGIVCSCTITKRHFGNGYHVEWNRKIKSIPNSSETLSMESPDVHVELKSNDSLSVGQTESMEQVAVETKNVIEDLRVEEPPFPFEVEIQKEQQIKSGESSPVKETDDEAEEVPKRIMHPLTWAIWGAWSIGIVFIFFVTFYAEALIGVAVFFFLAMIFAFFIIHSLRKHPEKYRLKKLSYGFVIPAIIFGGIVLAGLGLFLIMMLA
ncbi:hypothetical protein [Fluviicola chungangensis]|uniref:Uncharacterized protein n=1 Tax=Fluviicola chungangensis TaxID=2597671 RepID=A0A556N2A4_9FLAO|nr:hypothetical protein [Fluviicola chungangensis]TSJ46320.1 hypothetical protein FO442_03960 [Fluviicola chungangensis]